ncbi:MAG: SpoIIE family protein phosphatase [Bacteroidota bacterium]
MPRSAVFSRADRILLSLGVVGLAVFLLLIPRVHPDAVPAYPLSEEEILDRAQGFAYNRGYDVSRLQWEVFPIRNERLLDSLQTKDAPPLRTSLLSPSVGSLPAYGWEAAGTYIDDDDNEASSRITLNLTQSGDIWKFDARTPEVPAPVREVLLQAEVHQASSATFRDSLSTADLAARFWSTRSRMTVSPRGDSVPSLFVFNSRDAETFSRFYLQKTLLRNYQLAVDSVSRPDGPDNNTVRVFFSGIDPSNAVPLTAEVDVNNGGGLERLFTRYNPTQNESRPPPPGPQISFGQGNQIPGIITIVVTALIVIFIFILFLRRLNARLIDVKGALQDATWGGVFAFLAAGNAMGWRIFLDSSSFWAGLLSGLGVTLIMGSIGAFAVFIISCATDSIARAIWPKRLETLTLARNVRFFNVPMGRSLIRSLGIAAILLGATTLILYLPGIRFDDLTETIGGTQTFSPFLGIVTVNGLTGILTCMILLSLGATVYSRRASKGFIIGLITLIAMLMQIGPVSIGPFGYQYLISGGLGAAIAITLFRFDYFSSFGGFVLFSILWETIPIWMIEAAGANWEVIALFALFPIFFILGFVGLKSGKEAENTNNLIPTYLQELALQERLQGELEIARQVQSSLLPRRMPNIKGIQIAAMCLPAQEVGGDYFDFIQLDAHRTAVVIGDVSGKGIQAGFFMTLTKGFLHATCQAEDSPAEVLTRVNTLFCNNAPRGTFISLIYGILDISNQTFTFARAGHDPMLYLSKKREGPTLIKPQGIAIGLTPKSTFAETIEDEVLQLNIGDLLVFYTDGVTEAVNPSMEQFGVDRLSDKIAATNPDQSARHVMQEVSEHIQAFVKSAGRADDMTMVVLRIATPHQVKQATPLATESQSWLEHDA